MPRYAKGTIENALFQALKQESAEEAAMWLGKKERRNSKRSRAHRIEAPQSLRKLLLKRLASLCKCPGCMTPGSCRLKPCC